MPNLFNRLLETLATARAADLRRQVQFLRAENEILKSRLKCRLRTTRQERIRLVRLGKPLGSAIHSLISIVTPATFVRWVNRLDRPAPARRRRKRPGRPRRPEAIRQLVLRLAQETDWGYTRIWGELKKLGITISRGTVANILKEAGMPRAPQRGETTWDQFMRAHAETLWGCDFVAQRVLTRRGFVTAFVMVFLHLRTRQVYITPATLAPSDAWVARESERVIAAARAAGHTPDLMLRDRDSKFGAGFFAAMRAASVRTIVLPKKSPNLNSRAERFIQTLRLECLDRFVVLGTRHLDRLVREYADYYNRQRPHSRLPHCTPSGRAPPAAPPPSDRELRCDVRLGGLVRHYYRRAA
ncbi:MAG: integrase core domain-containing protein [Phycisphaerales bacterium]